MDSNIAPHCLAVLCACFRVRTVPASDSEGADACLLGQARQIMVELGHLLIDAVTGSISRARGPAGMDSSLASRCLAVLCACFRVRTVPASDFEGTDACMLGQVRQIMVELGHLLIDAVNDSIRVVHA